MKKERKKNIEFFNKMIESGDYKIVGDFKNEYGEKFVVFKQSGFGSKFNFITGDEFDWDIGHIVEKIGNGVVCHELFYLNSDEVKEVLKIIK